MLSYYEGIICDKMIRKVFTRKDTKTILYKRFNKHVTQYMVNFKSHIIIMMMKYNIIFYSLILLTWI